MRRVLPAEPAVLAELQPLGRLLLVLRRAVVPALTVTARQMDDVPHGLFHNLRNRARADGAPAFTNREARALLQRHRHVQLRRDRRVVARDRKSTRLNSSHGYISYAVFCLKKKKTKKKT